MYREFWIYPFHRIISEGKKYDGFPVSTVKTMLPENELHVVESFALAEKEKQIDEANKIIAKVKEAQTMGDIFEIIETLNKGKAK